jgi:hypothetical protein
MPDLKNSFACPGLVFVWRRFEGVRILARLNQDVDVNSISPMRSTK